MKAKKTLGSAVASLGLVVGFAALAGATPDTTISNTGPDSYNKVKNSSSQSLKVKNTNNIGVDNSNNQTAASGKAEVVHNTTGGGATSGATANSNSLGASVTVTNAAMDIADPTAGSLSGANSTIDTTGPDSKNKIENTSTSHVKVTNTNNLSVNNVSSQVATSGEATVAGNTTGCSATSGNVSNSNATTVSFNVSN